jgi:hypothetical protein
MAVGRKIIVLQILILKGGMGALQNMVVLYQVVQLQAAIK